MQKPTAGEMNKRVRIRRWQDQPGDSSGIDQTVDAGTPVWARIEPTGAALFYGMAQVEPGITHRLATRRTSAINEDTIGGGHVVDHGCMRYRVRRATDLNGGRAFVLLDLEKLGVVTP